MRDHSEDIHQDMENFPGNIHCDARVVHVQIKFSTLKVVLIGSKAELCRCTCSKDVFHSYCILHNYGISEVNCSVFLLLNKAAVNKHVYFFCPKFC